MTDPQLPPRYSSIPGQAEEINTLERILVNALEHFSKYGYLGASVREITEAARVTKPTLYYYFRNKEELYRGLAKTCFDKLIGSLAAAAKEPCSLEQRFSKFVSAYYEFCERDLPSARFVQMIAFTPSRDVPEVGIEDVHKQIGELIGSIVAGAVKMAEVTAANAACVQLMLESLFTMVMSRKLSGRPLDVELVRQTVGCAVSSK